MKRTSHPDGRRGIALMWTDTCWPVVAGTTGAAGLVELCRLMGPLAVAVIFVSLWMYVALMAYGIGADAGLRRTTAARVGLVSSIVTVVLLGLVTLLPVAGWLIAAAVGLTSPPALGLLPRRARRSDPAAHHRVTPVFEDAEIDRIFDQLVADFDRDVA